MRFIVDNKLDNYMIIQEFNKTTATQKARKKNKSEEIKFQPFYIHLTPDHKVFLLLLLRVLSGTRRYNFGLATPSFRLRNGGCDYV